jgi:hypothetical protein
VGTDLSLKSHSGEPLGSFDEVRAKLARVVPGLEFYWTASGKEKLRIAAERQISLPARIRETLESLPALHEARLGSDTLHVLFGLGPAEPVQALFVQLRGENSEEIERVARALESEFDARLEPDS